MSGTSRSVWDFPRPPVIEPEERPVEVYFGGLLVARSEDAVRVLETSHPPGIYLPIDDVVPGSLSPARGSTFCEYKGVARYWDVAAGGRSAPRAAWGYPEPTPGYEQLTDRVSFYPGRMDRCVLGGEDVAAQDGDFYGGWITDDVTGPFKGGPGTAGW